MTEIRPATKQDLPAVAEFLAGALRGEGGAARYQRYFEYTWLPSRPDLGVLLEDDGRIRGFVGAIYSERRMAGVTHRLCNLTSVAVDDSHRKLTLRLFSALLANKHLTFTCFSASEQVAKILDFFKFQHRPSDKLLIAPISGLGSLRSGLGVRVISEPAKLDAELPQDQRTIACDHRASRCGQLLLVHGDRRCFVVTARRGRGVRAFADVLYASDPDLLMQHLPWIHAPLFRAHRTLLTGIDRTWVRDAPRASYTYSKLRPIYARGPLALAQIDALYSELVPIYA